MDYPKLLELVKAEVHGFYQQHHKQELIYHNLEHTEAVVRNTSLLARHYNLNDHDFFVVQTAAWFHDLGYYLGEPMNHEQAGADAATRFLESQGVDAGTTTQVRACILSTMMPQRPANLLEQIVCDADLYHWGTDDFAEANKRMRKEVSARAGHKIGKKAWNEDTIRLLMAHHYHTGYAVELLQKQKARNLEALIGAQTDSAQMPTIHTREKQVTQSSEYPSLHTVTKTVGDQQPTGKPAESKRGKKPVSDRPERGIETMFRISSANHQRLSDMADNKANIMITTTSIILSVLLSVLLRKLEDNPGLVIPTMILLLVCVVTMVFSILATRPAIPPGTFTPQNITDKKVNLLFFGNFYRMEFEEYDRGMQEMMKDREFLYGSLTRDVYSQGVVLGRKYRLLRIAYNIFMFGVIMAVLAFIIASF